MAGDQTEDGLQSRPLVEDEDYFSVTVRTMRLNKTTRGFSKYYAAVYGNFEFLALGGKVDIQTVTDPSKFNEIDAKRTDRIAYFNQPVLGPVPYRGGSIDAEIGLFAVKSTDLTEPYLQLLGEVGNQAGVSILSNMLSFSGLIKKGIGILTDTTEDARSEAAYDTVWENPKTGYYVVISNNEVAMTDLRIVSSGTPGDVVLANREGEEVQGYSYTIVSVTAVKKHPYWKLMKEINDAHREAFDLLYDGNESAAREALSNFRRVVLKSRDLISYHKQELIKQVNKRFEEEALIHYLEAPDVPSLGEYDVFRQ